MSQVTIPVGCSIYSKTIHEFGMILGVRNSESIWPYIVVQYEGEDSFMTDINDYEECLLEGTIVVYNKELTEQEKLVERLKHS
jgi:hypothetical protein